MLIKRKWYERRRKERIKKENKGTVTEVNTG
jgi:hypothetical protein